MCLVSSVPCPVSKFTDLWPILFYLQSSVHSSVPSLCYLQYLVSSVQFDAHSKLPGAYCRVNCPMIGSQRTLPTVYSILFYSILYNYSFFIVHCPKMSTVSCPLSTVHCPLSTVHWPLTTDHCPLSTVHCPLSPVPCLLFTVHFPLFLLHCPLSKDHCPFSTVRFQLSAVPKKQSPCSSTSLFLLQQTWNGCYVSNKPWFTVFLLSLLLKKQIVLCTAVCSLSIVCTHKS